MIPSSSLNKVMRSHCELTQVQLKIDCRIAEKEDKFMLFKNFGKALEGIQLALESEFKSEAKALHMKETLEGDIADLGIALEHANAGSIETQGSIKKYVIQIRDGQAHLGEEFRQQCYVQEVLVTSERKTNSAKNACWSSQTTSGVLLSRTCLIPTRSWPRPLTSIS